MNIGIDIDGVLTDLGKYTIEYGTKMCIEENWPLNLNIDKYWETELFNWTEGQDERFWNRYLVKYVTEESPRSFSKEIIEKLKQGGNNIYIITARDESGLPPEAYGKMEELTKEWLRKNNIIYDKLIFAGNKEKLQQCMDNNVDITPENYETLKKGAISYKGVDYNIVQVRPIVNIDDVFQFYVFYCETFY